jgi:hypothetical protein
MAAAQICYFLGSGVHSGKRTRIVISWTEKKSPSALTDGEYDND